MINDCRRVFNQGDFPFYIVSLPLYPKPASSRKVSPGFLPVSLAS